MWSFLLAAWNALRSYYVILLVGIIFVARAEHYPENTLSHHLARDIGISFVVAFVIIITIERSQRKELNEFIHKSMSQTHTHLFQTIFGVEFPQRVWDFIRDRIMRETFFRVDTNVVYTIKLSDPAVTKFGMRTVVLETETNQTVKNLTGRELIYPARYFVEKDPSAEVGGVAVTTPTINLFVNDDPITPAQHQSADDKWEDTPDFHRHQHNVTIAARGEAKIKIVNIISSKLVADTEVWRSLYSCDGLRFIIKFPNTLRVGVDAMHADEIEILHRSDTLISCRIKAPLLPHNGFMFWWTPCNHQDPATDPAA
ncbi:hypothetical protein MKK64_23300 [Methylobacterium sp. E-025]|uniref:hypothetical protein n=1 Tax=Methylobacterium sp. E-025 TaxID=2836561 RepID=UPI001FB94FC1|nr:hypothetical protein [Methylobacterium sp. E-025]MCJ2114100.1 hypothetical protein [Methylobacterium sp. E-025]